MFGTIGAILGAIANVAGTANNVYSANKNQDLVEANRKLTESQLERKDALAEEDAETRKKAQENVADAALEFNYLDRS